MITPKIVQTKNGYGINIPKSVKDTPRPSTDGQRILRDGVNRAADRMQQHHPDPVDSPFARKEIIE